MRTRNSRRGHVVAVLLLLQSGDALITNSCGNRREFIDETVKQGFGLAGTGMTLLGLPGSCVGASAGDVAAMKKTTAETFDGNSGLAAKLSKRDASALRNSVFNVPPSAQVYPQFMRGEWDVSSRFRGFLFPSQKISKEKLTAKFEIPGFQKCSIATVCDVGRDLTNYRMKIEQSTGLDDRVFTLQQQINANLDSDAVKAITYDVRANPNRLSIEFVPYRTRNAERIELFCNARESELVPYPLTPGDDLQKDLSIFVCSEYIRQVTFSLSQEFGVARQVVGNYAHFWTWRQQADGESLTGNLLTAAYLDPQDPLYFDEPSKPVAVYSHDLMARKVSTAQ